MSWVGTRGANGLLQISKADGASPPEWSHGAVVELTGLPVHRQFEQRAAESPERVALSFIGGEWTYGELNRRANRIAHRLRQAGVGPDTPVGVSVERAPGLVAALFGILKAGGSYVALEPSLPSARLRYMRQDAAVDLVVADAAGRGIDWPGAVVLNLEALLEDEDAPDHDPAVEVSAENLAYTLYTSGTTGRPKGVMIPHRALANLAQSYSRTIYAIAEQTASQRVFLLKASYTFDMFVAELFPPLAAGARVAVAPRDAEFDSQLLGDTVSRLGVTDLWATPSALKVFDETLDPAVLASLSIVYSGGEALTGELCAALVQRWGVVVWNLYGPTEMCVGQTAAEVSSAPVFEGVASIGGPTANHDVMVVDDGMVPCAVEVDGEIVIAGAGEARGYLGMARRTALSFVPSTFGRAVGARMYRTGDVGRWSDEGQIAYRGRQDDQLQIRGVRVELDDVEGHIERAPGVRQAAVRPLNLSNGRADALVAYVVATRGDAFDVASVRAHLFDHLPQAVIPGRFVQLDELPCTPSGKVDRNALPDPDEHVRSAVRVAPRDDLERSIAAIWCEQLGLSEVGVHDNFFELGGHSLSAVRVLHALAQSLEASVSLRDLFDAPTIAGLTEVVRGWSRAAEPPIERHEAGAERPLSADQLRMWFLQTLDPQSAAYNEPVALRLHGELDVEALRRAVGRLVDRHEVLRTLLIEGSDGPVQHILPCGESSPWEFVDASDAATSAAALQRAQEIAVARIATPFDLASQTPLRVSLIRIAPADHVLLLLFHHIAIDDWTSRVAIEELGAVYEAERRGEAAQLGELPIQYADYAAWQAARMQGVEFETSVAFWREALQGAPDHVEWPIGDPPRGDAHPLGTVEFAWSHDLSQQVRELARSQGTTLFVVLHALFAAYLARFSGQRDLTLGVPTTMRQRPELQGMVGLFLNTVPIRSQLVPDATFESWLRESAAGWHAALQHQWVPLEAIVQAVGAKRRAGGLPLFDVMFTYVPGGKVGAEFGAVDAEPFECVRAIEAKATLSVLLGDERGRLRGGFEFDGARFERASIERMVRQFERFVTSCAAAPARRLGSHALIDEEERRLVDTWSQGQPLDVPALPIHRLFERRVQDDPQRVALRFDDGHWTYDELNRRANRIAHRLREMGVGPDTTVGVSVERGSGLVAALLGVLKSGGAYVALEPSLPSARLEYMRADSGVAYFVVDAVGREAALPEGHSRALDLEELWSADGPDDDLVGDQDPESIAYTLYTSGTTGRPKGAMIPHRAISNLTVAFARNVCEFPEVASERVVLIKASYTFDMFVAELFPTLVAGATVAVAPPGAEVDPGILAAAIRTMGVTDFWTTPTNFKVLVETLDPADVETLSVVYSGGEVLSNELCMALQQRWGVRVWNVYGPTEMCVGQTVCAVPTIEAPGGAASIGRPVDNYRVHILDTELQPSPRATDGAIVISGAGEGRGYRAMPRRTALSFVPSDLAGAAGARMYVTGDVGRFVDGQIVYRGRRDDQLQVRGVRVELDEVEAHLTSGPGVRHAAVRAVNLSDGRADALVAYIVTREGETLDVGRLREHLAQHLARAVIPGRFIVLDEMPRTASGKIDRKALPDADAHNADADRVAPRDETERVIAGVWCEHLELDAVGIHQNFFELGGHSLLAIRVLNDISAKLDISVPIQYMFDFPTIAQFADALRDGDQRDSLSRIEPSDYDDEAPLSADQRGFWFLQKLNPGSAAYHVPCPVVLEGPLDREALRGALQALLDRHEILRTIFPAGQTEAVQRILPDAELPWEFEDLQAEGDPREAALRRVREARDTPFDLETETPFRTLLLQLAPDEHVLSLLFHHIALDAWAIELVVEEVEELYEARLESRDPTLEPLRLQYADYAIWQREALVSDAFETGIAYWRDYLSGARDEVTWRLGARPADVESAACYVDVELMDEAGTALQAFARESGASLFIVFQAAATAFLSRSTGQNDITVGIPVTMRRRAELQRMVGLLLNTVPTRTQWCPETSFRDWVADVEARWRGMMPHQWIPLDAVVQGVGARRPPDRMPLFDVIFSHVPIRYMPGESPQVAQLGDVVARRLEQFEGLAQAKASMTIGISGTGPRFGIGLEYDAARFRAEVVKQFAEQLRDFVGACVAAPDRPMGSHEVLDLGADEPGDAEAAGAPPGGASAAPSDARSELQRRLEKLPPEKRALLLKQIRERQRGMAAAEPQKPAFEGVDTVVRLKSGDDGAIPLVLVHAIGGTLFDYHGLVMAIDPRTTVLGVQAPGLIEGGQLPDTLQELAALHAAAVRHHLKGNRCRLAGWSFGGVVASEMVGALADLGVEIDHLYLLDSWAPDEYRAAAAAETATPFEGFAFNLASALGVQPERLESLRADITDLEESARLDWLASRLQEWSAGRLGDDAMLLGRYYQTFNSHIELYSAHMAAPLDCATTLVAALGDIAQPEDRGWSALIGNLQIERVSAGHFGLLRPPYVQQVCALMRRHR